MEYKQIRLNKEKVRIEFLFPFSMGMKNKVKALPDARYDGDERIWWLPVSEYSAKLVVKLGKDFGFLIEKPVMDLSRDFLFSKSDSVRKRMYPFQIAGLDFLHSTGGRAIIADEMGTGKQQPIDSRVLTPGGWVKIGNLQSGDTVIGSDGRDQLVLGVYPQGYKPVYRVEFSDGSSVEAGAEHLWTVRYRIGGRDLADLVLTTDQLRCRPEIDNPLSGKRLDLYKTDLYLPMLTGPVEFNLKEELPIPPYSMGYLLANGSLIGTSVMVSAHSEDGREVRDKFILEGMDASDLRSYPNHVLRFGVRGIISTIRKLALNVKSKDKFIPGIYFTSTVQQRIDLLHGLMDGDGSVRKGNRFTYHTTSSQLAFGIQELVEGLGGIASIRIYDRTKEGKTIEYQVRLRLPGTISPFRISRKFNPVHLGNHSHPVRTIKSVRYTRSVECVCIKVSNPDELYVTEHCILTHNTIEALGFIQERGFHSVLIVSPASVTYKWQDEIKKWIGVDSVVITKGKDLLPDTTYTIMSYAIFTNKIEDIRLHGYQLVVFDECHYLAHRDTARVRAAKSLNTPYFLGLSGTPFLNRPIELWPQLNMISPGKWNSYWKFAVTYCGAHREKYGWVVDGATHLKELKEELKTYYLRRTKQEVLTELPSLTRVNIPVDYAKEFARQYSDAVEGLLKKIGIGEGKRLTKLELIAELRQIIGHMKILPAVELAEDVLSSKQKVVLFAHHKAVVAELETKLKQYNPIKIVGDTSQKERLENVNAFLYDPKVRVAIISQAGGEGIDLYSADTLIFVEREWNPGKEGQIEARLHRIGQQSNVEVMYLIARGTIDERIHRIIEEKREVFGQLISIDDIPVLDLLEVSDER